PVYVVMAAVCVVSLCAKTGLAAGLRPAGQPMAAVPTPSVSQSYALPVRLGAVDSIIQQAIADGNIPGAVLVVGHNGAVIYRKAYGSRALEPKREVMTLDTV